MKTYEVIKELLEKYPETRNSDKELQWRIWEKQGVARNGFISHDDYIFKAKHFETIRRTRQKIQQKYAHLRASDVIQAQREEIRRSKGTWIFRDTINGPVAEFKYNQNEIPF